MTADRSGTVNAKTKRRAGLVEAIRRANQPKPAEPSVRLRAACTAAVLVSLAAPAAQGEMSWRVSFAAGVLFTVGMLFSYRTREGPPGWVKLGVAAGAILGLVSFVARIDHGPLGDITGVENPLTLLLAWILVVHSFHVPARRDVLFALGGSTALMAVAAAQATEMRFGQIVLIWVALSLWGLHETWSAAGQSARLTPPGVVGAVAAVAAVAAAAFLLLPAPTVALRLDFQLHPSGAGPVGTPGALAGDSGSPLQLSKPGSPGGASRVGGYLGFAGSLDTALRGRLSHRLVMRVRAERPSFWVGETFDHWSGASWSSTQRRTDKLNGGSPLFIPPPLQGATSGAGSVGDLQTFYLENATADLVFHAGTAKEIWFPANTLLAQPDGSLVSPVGLGKGAIYTVESDLSQPNPAQLGAAPWIGPFLPQITDQLHGNFTQLPKPYADVAALARSVTGNATSEYAEVEALIAWIGAHSRYSTDIPPLPPGGDTVEEFLFHTHVGFCEQISTSLAVMLRSLGLPAREAVGYVPGAYNPITDLYDVRAEDAHSWVQVWFPSYGWVSFDPTASVPDSSPSPGGTALAATGHFLSGLPWAILALAVPPVGAVALLRRWRRDRPATPAAAAARRIERAGRRAGRERAPSETITEYAASVVPDWLPVARAVEDSAYGGREITARDWARLVSAVSDSPSGPPRASASATGVRQ